MMLKSRADSTVKSFIRVIRKYMDWCKIKLLGIQLPFSVSVISLSRFGYNPNDYGLHSLRAGYITFAVHQSSNSNSENLLIDT